MNDFFAGLLHDVANTSAIEYIAVITGVMSVWYCRRQNILVYPLGLINVLIYVFLFFKAGMYANMSINAVFFVTSIYGWYNWSRNSGTGKLMVSQLQPRQWIMFSILIAVLSGGLFLLLARFTDSKAPLMDSFTTATFIVAMWLQAIKKVETWILWIAGDVLMIPLSVSMGLAFTSIQYVAFLLLAVSGYVEWSRSLKSSRNL